MILPEKPYYSLYEVVERWAKIYVRERITIETVCSFIEQNMLKAVYGPNKEKPLPHNSRFRFLETGVISGSHVELPADPPQYLKFGKSLHPIKRKPPHVGLGAVFVALKELQRFESAQPESELDTPSEETPTRRAPPHNPDGRKPGALTLGLTEAWRILQDQGNTALLQPGSLDGFLRELKRMITEGENQFSDSVALHIAEVKPSSEDAAIRTQDQTTDKKIFLKSKSYSRTQVSDKLHKIRKKFTT